MSDGKIEIPAVGAPRKLASRWLKFDVVDWFMLGVMICGVYLVGTLDFFVLTLVAIGVAVFLFKPLRYAKLYRTWLIKRIYYGFWVKRVLRFVLAWNGVRTDLGPIRRGLIRLFTRPDPVPQRVDWLYDIALLFNKRYRTYSVGVTGAGSAFSGMSFEDQADMLEQLGDEMRTFATATKLKARAGFVSRRRPYDPLEVEVQHNNNLTVGARLPGALVELNKLGIAALQMDPTDEANNLWLDEQVERLYTAGVLDDDEVADWNRWRTAREQTVAAATYGQSVDLVAILTFNRSPRLLKAVKKARKKQAGGVSKRDAGREDIVYIANYFRNTLENIGVVNPTIMDRWAMEEFVRGGWDVAGLNDYRHQVLDEVAKPEKEQQSVPYLPDDVRLVEDLVLYEESTYHGVFQVNGLPANLIPTDNMKLFDNLATKGYLTRTLASEIVTGNKEYRALGVAVNFITTAIDAVSSWVRTTPKSELRQQKLTDQERELADRQHIHYFNLYFDVASINPRDIEDDATEINRAIGKFKGSVGQVEDIWVPASSVTATTGCAMI